MDFSAFLVYNQCLLVSTNSQEHCSSTGWHLLVFFKGDIQGSNPPSPNYRIMKVKIKVSSNKIYLLKPFYFSRNLCCLLLLICRALADQLEGNEDKHKKYRNMVVEYILVHGF
jgi:hypothetical protein